MIKVYAVDVLVSTGDGTNKEKDAKTVIFKKTDMTYMLKMKTSREFFSQVTKTYGPMPFNLRNCDEEKKARMGVVECVKHNVVQPFHVLYEKEGTSVAQFKFTVLLMPNGPQKITGRDRKIFSLLYVEFFFVLSGGGGEVLFGCVASSKTKPLAK